jgi:hypothetical protein
VVPLFINTRSDKGNVDGLNVDQVRDLYNATGGTQLMNKTGSLR